MNKDDYAVVPAQVCAACGASGTVARGVRDLPFTYRNKSTVIPAVKGLYCAQCNEGFADAEYPQDWQRMSDAIDAFSHQVDAATASELREIRLKLGLRQSDAGKLFGGGATAFSEYERGKTQPHKSTVLLLKLLGKHPELLAELKTV